MWSSPLWELGVAVGAHLAEAVEVLMDLKGGDSWFVLALVVVGPAAAYLLALLSWA